MIHPDPALSVRLRPERPLAGGWYRIELGYPDNGVVRVTADVLTTDGSRIPVTLPVTARNRVSGMLRLDGTVTGIALTIEGSADLRGPEVMRIERTRWSGMAALLLRRARAVIARDGWRAWRPALALMLRLWNRDRTLVRADAAAPGRDRYAAFIARFDADPERERTLHQARLQAAAPDVSYSILAVWPPADPPMFNRALQSLAAQIYPRWTLVLVGRAGDSTAIASACTDAGVEANRLHVVSHEGSDGRLNASLAAAEGSLVLRLPDCGVLRPHALLELALTKQAVPAAAMIYADEDAMDPASGRRYEPRFKRAWSPDVAAIRDLTGPLTVYDRLALVKTGGWRDGLAGAAGHDLTLRVAEAAGQAGIVHLAQVLLHRVSPDPEPPSQAAQLQVTQDHLRRTGVRAQAVIAPRSRHPRIRYEISEPRPLVSLLIPTRDRAALLRTCIESIRRQTDYHPLEFIIMDNGSQEPATLTYLADLARQPGVRVEHCPGPFNYSALNNRAAALARGTVLGLLNNDLEAIEPDWLGELVGHALRPGVAAVGPKLLYPDRTIQHAGVAVGLGGVAGHIHKGLPEDAGGYCGWLETVADVSAVTGACLVIRRDLYHRLGGLDEDALKVAFNDVDFCLRARQAGYLNIWTPHAVLIHHESASRGFDATPGKARRFSSEIHVLQDRWGAMLRDDPYYSPHLTRDAEDMSIRAM